jgi:uncharacterized protein YeeX (DUF496 family)
MILLNNNISELQGFNVSAKELLNILNGLRLGQVIRGKVLTILGTGEVLALINGQKIKASSNLNLEIGDVLYLKVLSLKPNLLLQLYGIETDANSDPIVKVLKMFNLEESNLNKNIVSLMLKNNVTIDKNEIQKLSESLNQILSGLNEFENLRETDAENNNLFQIAKSLNVPLTDEKIIEAMLFLKSKNIPLTLKTSLIAFNFINKNSDLSNDINDFFNILKNTKNNSFINENLFSMLDINSGENIIEKIFQNMGYDYEKRVSEYTPEQKKINKTEISLKQITLEIINNFKSFEGLDNSEKLKLLALKILNNIEFQQILNTDDSGDIKNWYFQFPVNIKNENNSVELKIAGKNKKSGKINKVPYNFNLSVDLSGLGKVRSHGSLYNNSLSLSFYIQDSKNLNLFKEDFDYLRSKFSELGLLLQNATVETFTNENITDIHLFQNDTLTSINVKA